MECSSTWKNVLKWKVFQCSLKFSVHMFMFWQPNIENQFPSHLSTNMFLQSLWDLKNSNPLPNCQSPRIFLNMILYGFYKPVLKERWEDDSSLSKKKPYHRAIRVALKSYFWFHWNFKTTTIWSEKQYVKLWDLFPTLKLIKYFWIYFHIMVLYSVLQGINRVFDFLARLPKCH